jgi:glycosyltransferase involved in cell wall biosynthesis
LPGMNDSRQCRSLQVLAIDPFHGGSHRQFLRGVVDHSRHRWRLIVGKSVHWKWRMRLSPLELAAAARIEIDANGYPDVIFCTDMLDLPAWRGLLRDPRILTTPAAIYFHENQWSYPTSQHARADHHFGYTNLLSALSADACWFNSQFHVDDFLSASRAFVDRMPDGRQAHDFEQLEQRCRVIPPGFAPPGSLPERVDNEILTIGWVSRWEHDKRPDRLVELVSRLDRRGVDFRLVLLGPRGRQQPQELAELHRRFADRILYDGFAETSQEYWSWLRRLNVVVSTADHEFFGIAVCEAVWAGAVPVLPNRLSYPELVPGECLYESLDEAVSMIEELIDPQRRAALADASQSRVARLNMENTVAVLDDALEDLAGT